MTMKIQFKMDFDFFVIFTSDGLQKRGKEEVDWESG